ncbi:MAG: hypothetical protein ABIK09_04465 [Pseudomonadota bacterium]
MRQDHQRCPPQKGRGATAAALLILLLSAGHAGAAETVSSSAELAPWRGTKLIYRNVATAFSFDKGAELTYNPYYAMAFQVSPRWWFGRIFWVGADAGISREITDSDTTTMSGEVLWDDTLVRAGASSFYRIPGVGIEFSGGLDLIAPTSKLSQARSVYLGLRPSLGVSRTFPVLKGLTLFYSLQGTKFFNEYTTSSRKSPLIPGCSGGACDPYLNSGLRNPEWRMTNLGGISMEFTDWIGLSASAGLVMDFVYTQESQDPAVSFQPQEGQDDRRYTMVYEVEVHTRPMPSLGIAVGASTVNPQLKANSTYEDPFINRYTTLYIDLTFHVDGLVSQILNAKGRN